jgi:hypothetical protein
MSLCRSRTPGCGLWRSSRFSGWTSSKRTTSSSRSPRPRQAVVRYPCRSGSSNGFGERRRKAKSKWVYPARRGEGHLQSIAVGFRNARRRAGVDPRKVLHGASHLRYVHVGGIAEPACCQADHGACQRELNPALSAPGHRRQSRRHRRTQCQEGGVDVSLPRRCTVSRTMSTSSWRRLHSTKSHVIVCVIGAFLGLLGPKLSC